MLGQAGVEPAGAPLIVFHDIEFPVRLPDESYGDAEILEIRSEDEHRLDDRTVGAGGFGGVGFGERELGDEFVEGQAALGVEFDHHWDDPVLG